MKKFIFFELGKKIKGKSIFETFSVGTLVKFFIFARFFAFVMNDFCSRNPRIPEFKTQNSIELRHTQTCYIIAKYHPAGKHFISAFGLQQIQHKTSYLSYFWSIFLDRSDFIIL